MNKHNVWNTYCRTKTAKEKIEMNEVLKNGIGFEL